MSDVRPYETKTSPSPATRSDCAPGRLPSTAPSISVYAVEPSVWIDSVASEGPWKTVRWAMPAPIMAAAMTNATTAQTNLTLHTIPTGDSGGHRRIDVSD